ncbi:MAG: Peptidyl-tRNA hydrolase [Legionellaceae bacterium]
MAIKLIVGLGNPGNEYSSTRHNAGTWLTEKLAQEYGHSLRLENKFHGLTTTFSLNSYTCRLLNPLTYMNRSGQAVHAMSHFYQINPEEILIVHDELDLSPGLARLKFDGGHGGHNGLRNIISHLNTKQFYRARIGIGHPGDREKVAQYVLCRPAIHEQQQIDMAVEKIIAIIPYLLSSDMAKAMQQLNT